MAVGHKVGTVFAEVGLDYEPFTRAQKRLLIDATSSTKSIEGEFKKLGISSAREFDLMRAKVSNAYSAIAANAKSTANDILRAEQAKNAQLTRINEMQFGAQTSFLTKLKTHWLGVTAAIGSMAILKNVTMDIINTGMAAERMNLSLKAATGGVEAATSAHRYLSEESERLGLLFENQVSGYVKIAAAAKGTSLEGQSVRNIWRGIATAGAALQMSNSDVEGSLLAVSQMISKGKVSAEELRQQLGERLPGAFQIAARAMNMTTMELDEALKKGQIYAEDFLPKFAKAVEETYSKAAVDASDSATAAMNRYHNTMRESKETLSTVVIPVYSEFLELLVGTGEAARTIAGMHAGGFEVEDLTRGSGSVRLPITGDLYPPAPYVDPTSHVAAWKAWNDQAKERAKLAKEAEKAQDEWLDNYLKSVDASWKAEVKRNEGIGDLAVETSKEKTKAYEDFYKDVDRLGKKGFIAQTSQNQKLLENTDQMIDGQLEAVGGMYESEETLAQRAFDYQVSLLDQRAEYYYEHMQDTTQVDEWYNAAWEELAANRNSKDEQNLKDKADAYKEMYDILREHTTEYNEEIDELERQAAANRMLKLGELTGNYVLAMEAMTAIDREETRKRTLEHGSFFDGMRVGLDESTERTVTWAETGYAVYNQFSKDAKASLSNNLFHALKGDFDEFELDWETMWDNMLHTMTDMVAEMAVEAGAALAKDVLGEIGGWAASIFFHEGAWNVGHGLAGDEYPAVLQKGEMVIPKNLAEELRAIWKAGTPITTPAITGAQYGSWAGATEPGLTPGSYGMTYSSTYGLIPAASYSAAVGAAEAGSLGALSASEAAAGASTGALSSTILGNIAGAAAVIALPLKSWYGGMSSDRKQKHAFEDWYNDLPDAIRVLYDRRKRVLLNWGQAFTYAFPGLHPSEFSAAIHPAMGWLQQYGAPSWLTPEMVFAPRIPIDILQGLPDAQNRILQAILNQDSWIDTGINYERYGLYGGDNVGDMHEKAMVMRYGKNWQGRLNQSSLDALFAANNNAAMSFETGTGPEGLPRTGWYYGHKKEIVLNNEQSESIRRGKGESGRPMIINIDLGHGEILTYRIRKEADNVRIKADRRGMAKKRIYN
ncbi:MAG: tape measure protein [Dehalococcoidales bacterium]|nr:tape measure protein [Dehalococcoidales bacterium]